MRLSEIQPCQENAPSAITEHQDPSFTLVFSFIRQLPARVTSPCNKDCAASFHPGKLLQGRVELWSVVHNSQGRESREHPQVTSPPLELRFPRLLRNCCHSNFPTHLMARPSSRLGLAEVGISTVCQMHSAVTHKHHLSL